MKTYCFITDGHDMQQCFENFVDAKQAAMYAPWSNGLVYIHPIEHINRSIQADRGEVVFISPGAPYPRD